MFRRKSARTAALAVMAGSVLLAVPATADAATTAYTPQQACGSGYNPIDSFDLPGDTSTVYLTYNRSTRKNCAVTIKNTKIGTPTWTGAFLELADGSRTEEEIGDFSYYAVAYLYAPGQCIYYGGLDYSSFGRISRGPGWCS